LLTLKGLQTLTGALQNTTGKAIGHLDIPDFHKDGDSSKDHKILNFDPPQIEVVLNCFPDFLGKLNYEYLRPNSKKQPESTLA